MKTCLLETDKGLVEIPLAADQGEALNVVAKTAAVPTSVRLDRKLVLGQYLISITMLTATGPVPVKYNSDVWYSHVEQFQTNLSSMGYEVPDEMSSDIFNRVTNRLNAIKKAVSEFSSLFPKTEDV